jgi:uncharacterized protein YegP (UPF0339 family)
VPAKFVLKKGPTGKFRFNLVATNGQVIATSEAYETKAKALAGIESVRKNATGATLVDGTAPAAAKPAAKPAAKVGAAKAGAAKPAAKATKPAAKAKPAAKPARKAATK